MANHRSSISLGLLALIGLGSATGCVRWMRDPEFYSEELTELLESREDAFNACYDRYLEQVDPAAKGAVTLEFDVQVRTGQIEAITVVESTVSEPLAACVTDELAPLKLEPGDARPAHATFTWEFRPGSRKRPPADPFGAAQQAVLACYSSHLSAVDRAAQGDLVIDYAFDQATGAVARLEVVAEATTAPAPVVACATEILAAAKLDPEQLDERNAAGRRSFALRFEPYKE